MAFDVQVHVEAAKLVQQHVPAQEAILRPYSCTFHPRSGLCKIDTPASSSASLICFAVGSLSVDHLAVIASLDVPLKGASRAITSILYE